MEFTCAKCGEVYEKMDDEEWNDEKSDAEARDVFRTEDISDFVVVCDDCWVAMDRAVSMRVWAATMEALSNMEVEENVFS